MKPTAYLLFLLALIASACSGPAATSADTTPARSTSALETIPATADKQDETAAPTSSAEIPAPASATAPAATVTASLPPVQTSTGIPEPTVTQPTFTSTPLPPSATPLPMPALTRSLRLTSPAMQGEDVKQLQSWLLDLGYTGIGSADGVFGRLTDAAVREFQQTNTLTVDGIVGQMTWAALYRAASGLGPPTPTSLPPTVDPNFVTLQRGDNGSRVRDVQAKLVALGYPICDENAYFDLQTQTAIQLFQKQNGLAADGVVGSWTWSALFGASAQAMPQPQVAEYQFSGQYDLSYGINALAFDKTHLWFFANKQVIRMDPAAVQPISAFNLPDLGQQTGLDGIQYPVRFTPKYIVPLPSNDVIWLIGRYGFGAWPGSDAALAVDASGRLTSEPMLFPGQDDGIHIYDVAVFQNEIWAFQNAYGEVSAYLVDPAGGVIPTAYMGGEFIETRAYAWDNRRLWALVAADGYVLAPVDPYSASYGPGLGPCGTDLAWDGQWFWVLRENRLFAYDLTGTLKAAAVPPEGYQLEEIAAGSGYVAATAFGKGKNHVLVFKK